jgi:predicted nucleotidyltransferase
MSNQAIENFRERVIKRFKDEIVALILYGSFVRGEYSKYSDIDILIVTENKDRIREGIYDIAYDVDLEHDVLLSLLFLTPEEVEALVRKGSPFIEDIILEGVILYDRDKTFERIRERALKVEQGVS